MASENNLSFIQIADKLVLQVSQLMRTAKSEEDLRIGFEKILEPIQSELGIKSYPRYERLGKDAASIYKGRPDAVHGMVIIEYELPNAFKSKSAVEHAHNQLVDYIIAEASVRKEKLFLDDPKFIGIGFDGESIFFTKYQGDKSKLKTEFERSDFSYQGPYHFEVNSARTFLTYLRSLSRLPLTAEHLADYFGPRSTLAPTAVSAFADSLENWGSKRVRVFFNEWKRLFGIVYGEQFTSHQQKEAEALALLYKVGKETDFQELLFSVHTYFAFLMKLIVAELLSFQEAAYTSSYSQLLTHATKEELQKQLIDIENGGIYAKRGITNFLEGDFFRWYLDAWSPRLEEAIREITRGFSNFEPATSVLNPESTRDLLKKLYQYLVPQEVRHRLGEYYTPDWLAELLISETGYDGNTLKRFLDPACGSGTFLVFAIQRAKEYGQKHKEPKLETVKRILANIWGFDLNPLAVIAARTNYLFALGDLIEKLPYIEIPVYLADSILWPERAGSMQLHITDAIGGEYVRVQTSVKEFHVPAIWLNDSGFHMRRAAPIIGDMVKQGYKPIEAMRRLKKEGLSFPPHEKVVESFYEELLELEKQGKNGIWARFLKNAFAPMVAEKFDFVVGNPPWIRWDFLSKEYREATLSLWKHYGLFSLKGFAARLGGGKKDFSMLFTYAASDYYLKDGSKLGFLITQEVLKSKGAGEGFRRFKLGLEGKNIKIIKAHDFVSVHPFEGAANKTAAIILKKGEETTYPIPYILWSRKKGVGKIPTDALLNEAIPFLQRINLEAKPIGTRFGSWQTLSKNQYNLGVIENKNFYIAHSGAYISPYGVFWIEINQVLSNDNIIINNLIEKGKTVIPQVNETIESDLVYPALRGSDIQRWRGNSSIYILLTQDPDKSEPYIETQMKYRWPRTYAYLTRFREILLSRASKTIRSLAERVAFYAVFGVGKYTMAKYKVVWKQMTNDLFACVISQVKTPIGFKTIIPLHTTALIGTDNEPEAHYICAIINSHPVRDFIKSYSSAGRGFGTPSIMEHVGIPKFDSKNKLHQQLAKISKELHELKIKGAEEKIPQLEEQNDELVKKLFNIKV